MNPELVTHFEDISKKLSELKSYVTVIQSEIKHLEKNVNKEYKQLNKMVSKKSKTKSKEPRQHFGFARPTKVSNELCHFMNKEEGTELARTEVTKAIIGYIQEHKLQNNENRRVIMPDETLKTLLGVKDAEELNYFNLQKYMNKHFISKKNNNLSESSETINI